MQTTPERQAKLLDSLHRYLAEPKGKTPIGVWDKLQPDYTADSIKRINRLLVQMRSMPQGWENRSGAENFLLTLAAYLAEYVVRLTGVNGRWTTHGRFSFDVCAFNPTDLVESCLKTAAPIRLDNLVWQLFSHSHSADCNAMSRYVQDYYRLHRTLPGGLAHADALHAIDFDGSLTSLRRIDAFLEHIRQHDDGILHADTQPKRNLIFLLAFYCAETACRHAGKSHQWLNRRQISETTGSLNNSLAEHAALYTEDGITAPIAMLCAVLDGRGMPVSQWESCLKQPRTHTVSPEEINPDQLAARITDHVIHGRTRDGSRLTDPSYLKELRALTPDYSMDSLQRLDELLYSIRNSRPDFETFIRDSANQQFLHFCACYLAKTVALNTNNTLKMLGYNEIRRQMPDLPCDWYSTYAARIGRQIFFPIGRIGGTLFDEQPESCTDFARMMAQHHTGNLYAVKPNEFGADNIAENLQSLLFQAGSLAAAALYRKQAEPHTIPLPVLYSLAEDGEWYGLQMDLPETEQALSEGFALLDTNPHRHTAQIFLYEGYANLPQERLDAFILEIRSYGGNPLVLHTMLPFTFRSGSLKVHEFTLNLLHSSERSEAVALAACLYRGMDAAELPPNRRHWRMHYQALF